MPAVTVKAALKPREFTAEEKARLITSGVTLFVNGALLLAARKSTHVREDGKADTYARLAASLAAAGAAAMVRVFLDS